MTKQKKIDYEKRTEIAISIGVTLMLVLLVLRLF